ncbi:hypothetical protein E1B28_009010 [Marasmius oreades]|uniref:Uncharacterized protein n=1 Tax=Marasmius oreades TaxID=181124 RepID=A0A9P7S0T6_9AGAR|nr:uncharacterized protein E1B28_009010 [Marasmius oreades]KAG7092676.1 hypothetical protein E1B28_009010 [Marasmius oreades]
MRGLLIFLPLYTLLVFLYTPSSRGQVIDRRSVVNRYNPTRNASSLSTPMQVGNGNFAFGADITGMQTFQPFAIMSSWGWKNDSLPPGKTVQDVEQYRGVSWLNHGRTVLYDFGGGNPIEQWLISNPNRVNLGRIGLVFGDSKGQTLTITENDLSDASQELELWTGILTSNFTFDGVPVMVRTASAQLDDTVAFTVVSSLVEDGRIAIFIDFPWNDGKTKFSAPFVGNWNATSNHTTTLTTNGISTYIAHELDSSVFMTSLNGDGFSISRDSPNLHRYSIHPSGDSSSFSFSAAFGLEPKLDVQAAQQVMQSSVNEWEKFWEQSGFIDVFTDSTDPRADELQRRIILSRYLMRVNEAGDTPPQESGLVNDGWVSGVRMTVPSISSFFLICIYSNDSTGKSIFSSKVIPSN